MFMSDLLRKYFSSVNKRYQNIYIIKTIETIETLSLPILLFSSVFFVVTEPAVDSSSPKWSITVDSSSPANEHRRRFRHGFRVA
ncbi:unnamed protein product [Arabis nemorensis]|uniref:Uncharacterized protein n=1 Tax=Arabis nemorensis TaxID=586526 RepID=A0A565BU87_9BRAS|nr:unnamed protein product [Arabis nemorensis]